MSGKQWRRKKRTKVSMVISCRCVGSISEKKADRGGIIALGLWSTNE